MAGTYGVDIKFLHNLDVLQHTFAGNHISAVRIHFMTVGSLEEYRLTVDEYLSAFQLNLAETNLDGNYLYCAVPVFQGSGQCIKIGCFGCPFGRIGDIQCSVQFARTFQVGGSYTVTLGICEV